MAAAPFALPAVPFITRDESMDFEIRRGRTGLPPLILKVTDRQAILLMVVSLRTPGGEVIGGNVVLHSCDLTDGDQIEMAQGTPYNIAQRLLAEVLVDVNQGSMMASMEKIRAERNKRAGKRL